VRESSNVFNAFQHDTTRVKSQTSKVALPSVLPYEAAYPPRLNGGEIDSSAILTLFLLLLIKTYEQY